MRNLILALAIVTVAGAFLGLRSTALGVSQTYTVNSTNDPGNGICDANECTLREAITAANSNGGQDTIRFVIPGAGVKTITPLTALPALTDAATIDGTTQPGATCAARNLLIELSGVSAPDPTFGLVLTASGSSVRGLAIEFFSRAISVTGSGASVTCDNIGTDGTGTINRGNEYGVYIDGASNVVVGGATADLRNIIAFNSAPGIAVTGLTAAGNSFRQNSMFSNAPIDGAGLDLGDDGVTFNDPSDSDTGPNTLLNYPILTSAASDAVTTTVNGAVSSAPSSSYSIDFYSNPTCHPSGFGEGKAYLGSVTNLITGTNGVAPFAFSTNLTTPAGQFITATTTSASGSTSEFSPCLPVNALWLSKTTLPTLTTPGGALQSTLVLTNGSAVSVATSGVSDALPAGGTFVAAGSSPTCAGTTTVVCTTPSSLAAAATATFTVNWTAPGSAGVYTNAATSTNGASLANSTAYSRITVQASVPVVTSLVPSSATATGPQFTLTVNGSGFTNASVVRFNGQDRATTFFSANQLTATILASDIALAQAGTTPLVTIFQPGLGETAGLPFTINNPVPTLTSLTPPSQKAGSDDFTLTVNGTNFVGTSIIRFNGDDLPTTYVSGTQLTADIDALQIATPGSITVAVFTPAPGGGLSNTLSFSIDNPVPTITSLSPVSATQGGGSQIVLQVTGTHFLPSSVVLFNGSARSTAYTDASHLTAIITVADQASAQVALITVSNPAPGGGVSQPALFPINPSSGRPLPIIIGLAPAAVAASPQSNPVSVMGQNFQSDSVVRWNGVARSTTFLSSTQLLFSPINGDFATPGAGSVTVFTPGPGGGLSNAVLLPIKPVPAITSISPSSAIALGQTVLELTINGANFLTGAVVRWDGDDLPTTFVSGNQLKAQLSVALQSDPGTHVVTVKNADPGGGLSAPANFTLSNPAPTLTSISPNQAPAGAAAFTLTVTGTNFVASSSVRWNGVSRPTVYVNGTTLTASISANDVASAGVFAVSVSSPAPGGGISNALPFSVLGPPSITTLTPGVVVSGGPDFVLTVNGSNFAVGAVVKFNGSDRVTTYVNVNQVTAQILQADIASSLGPKIITVTNPGPGGTSQEVTLPVRSRADATCNGVIAPDDAIRVIRTIALLATPVAPCTGDADGVGGLTANDALLILRIVAGLAPVP